MSKEISIKTINNVKECLLRIYDVEYIDDYGNDYYIVSANERLINHYLKDYSEHEKDELLRLIHWTNDDNVSELEKHGWKVIREKNKNE